jgi:hypothetical protein
MGIKPTKEEYMNIKYKDYTIHISYRAFIETKDGKVITDDNCKLVLIEDKDLGNVIKNAIEKIEEDLTKEKKA